MPFRFDRFATLYAAGPIRRAFAQQGCIPILMYHAISDEPESAQPYYRTTTTPAMFATHMQYLAERGYRTVDLGQALSSLHNGGPSNAVVITFDDGFRDFYREAFPVLNRYSFSATMFLPTAYIGTAPAKFKGKDCLTWSEVRELHRQGILFGSHTVTHPQLYGLNAQVIEEELTASKETIEQQLGAKVDSFAYPYAFPEADSSFKQMLQETLCRAGYGNGVCTTIGRTDRGTNPFFLKRLPMNSCDDLLLFEAKLDGAYDWLATPQLLVKMAKKWTNAARQA